jgi:uncharacterized circularly permuted ATP-grasp superfamily protein/uncharacterized alpha-E superfamily protein
MPAIPDMVTDDQDDAIAALLAGYRPLPGIHDEMVDAEGRLRPHWRPMVSALAGLGRDEIARRFAAADRHLRDSGVFYRVHEDPTDTERAWPLSHVPMILDATEWRLLRDGLIERARLLETILGDAYGDGTLVRDGRLPAAVVAGNPEFLRPLAGIAPEGGAHLRVYAADLGRGADGRWWVLADRTQAPSGLGYALENRIALSRAFPDMYRALRVTRLAPFFQDLQSDLTALNRHDESRVALLTPGPMNETYFEHAYLARYLGFLLVEGEDLSVREDGVFIRTISGLKRVDVLLRRLDGDFADPLELNVRSRLGVPGLVQAVRDGRLAIANALGAGLVEARAMLAFMPALAKALTGKELAIPNIATWWLGEPKLRAAMLERFDELVLAPAFGELPAIPIGDGRCGGDLSALERKRVLDAITDRGVDLVAQEAVTLSTTPVWHEGGLTPRPCVLRMYATRIGDHWEVLPGGFVRVTDTADTADARAISLQKGGRTADAWVPSDAAVAETTLLPAPERVAVRRSTGWLPSRAADNLFWVGRYIERAEATLRIVRAVVNRSADLDVEFAPIVDRLAALLAAWDAVPDGLLAARPALIARAALQGGQLGGSLPRLVASARYAASVIRDRFSPDAWRAINRLVAVAETPLPEGAGEDVLFQRVDDALRIVASFSGLAQENMTQLAGWRFLELGRRVERGIITCRYVRAFASPPVVDRALDTLLELTDSQITYRQRYVMVAARAPVVDLVTLDPHNPRSVAYQLDRIEQHLAALPQQQRSDGRLSPPRQLIVSMVTALLTADATEVDDELVLAVERSLMTLSEAIASSYLVHTEAPAVDWGAMA